MPVSPAASAVRSMPAAEGTTGATDDNDPQTLVSRKVIDERIQVARPLLVGAVQHVRTIEDQRRDAVVDRGIHRFKLHASLPSEAKRSSTSQR